MNSFRPVTLHRCHRRDGLRPGSIADASIAPGYDHINGFEFSQHGDPCDEVLPRLLYLGGGETFAGKTMKPIAGRQLIRPEDLVGRPCKL